MTTKHSRQTDMAKETIKVFEGFAGYGGASFGFKLQLAFLASTELDGGNGNYLINTAKN